MSEGIGYILFIILRSVFHGNKMSGEDKHFITKEILDDVLKLASKHDIAHLIALALLNDDWVLTQNFLQHCDCRAKHQYSNTGI